MMTIPWDQPATLIDLDGKVPVIATIRECVLHYTLFKPCLLYTSPSPRDRG